MIRLAIGFICAALWLPTVSFIISGVYGKFWFTMTAGFTVPLTIFVGIPLYFLMRKKINLLVCAVGGVAIGVIGSLVFMSITNYLAFLKWFLVFISMGFVSSIIFWVVGVRNNTLISSSCNIKKDKIKHGRLD